MLSDPGQSARHVPTKKSPCASCPHRLALLTEATLAGPQRRRSAAPSGSLRAARLEIERLMSARHAVLSQGAKQVPPHFPSLARDLRANRFEAAASLTRD
jgi:hypothetical protein